MQKVEIILQTSLSFDAVGDAVNHITLDKRTSKNSKRANKFFLVA